MKKLILVLGLILALGIFTNGVYAISCAEADLNGDGAVDSNDVALINAKIPSFNCSETNNWCDKTDVDKNGQTMNVDAGLINELVGCSNISYPCVDSKGGLYNNNLYIKGKVTGVLWNSEISKRVYSEVEDYCIKEGDSRWAVTNTPQPTIAKYFCAPGPDGTSNYINVNGYVCPAGYLCNDGACSKDYNYCQEYYTCWDGSKVKYCEKVSSGESNFSTTGGGGGCLCHSPQCPPKPVGPCEKYYTCPDGTKVQYCFSTTTTISTTTTTTTGGGGCGCKSNPASLCKQPTNTPSIYDVNGNGVVNSQDILWYNQNIIKRYDFNNDGVCDENDLVSINKAISNGDYYSQYDINGNGEVNSQDLLAYQALIKQYDFNFDGKLDKLDEEVIRLHISTSEVKEKVKCIFSSSNEIQKCYTSNVDFSKNFYCSGTGSCISEIYGNNGDILLWKSSCGGYGKTILDGVDENVKFECAGSICGNGICETGEGEICVIGVVHCKEGEKCESPIGGCNIICQQDCNWGKEIVAKFDEKFQLIKSQTVGFEGAQLKIKFNDLWIPKCYNAPMPQPSEIVNSVTQAAENIGDRVVEVAAAKIIYTGNVIESIEDPVAATQGIPIGVKCFGGMPTAVLQIKYGEKTEVIKLELKEKKQIFDFTIGFFDYDSSNNQGIFVVTENSGFFCPKNCICDENGNVTKCKIIDVCPEDLRLCSDGICRKECAIVDINNTVECNFGCAYNNKCLPYGLRVGGLYCSVPGDMKTELGANEACENNFECKTNVCVDGKCISSNVIQKILGWFKRFFGGK